MRQCIVVAILFTLLFGCTSRYRLDFFLTENGKRNKAKVIERQYIVGSQLNDPLADEKVVAGEGNTILVTMSFRGTRHAAEYGNVLGYDENLRYRLYVHMKAEAGPQTVPLSENSFLHLVGRFDLPMEAKIYLPSSGQIVVDSVHENDMFATLKGEFANSKGETVNLDGRLKVKVKR